MLSIESSRQRQGRLRRVIADQKLDAIVVGLREHVYYFSSVPVNWLEYGAFVQAADGQSLLISSRLPPVFAADDLELYEARFNATLRQEQPAVVAEHVVKWLKSRAASRVGIDASMVNSQLALQWTEKLTPIDPLLWQMRRRKDADELAMMRRAIDCTAAMYRKAREILRPGITELEMFAELQTAAVMEAGAPMTALLGNDFKVGGGGGAPRADRRADAGELYVLDLGPTYGGYFADNCRTFSVDGSVSDPQRRAWEAIVGVFPIVEKMARPGASCRDLFRAADEQLSQTYGKPLKHHLGHGVGLQPHEFPHLNLQWDDVLEEGDVFTAEPGLYGSELRGGIRIEQNYLVTATGIESLLSYPLEMV